MKSPRDNPTLSQIGDEIRGFDQQKARNCWSRLAEETNFIDQTLVHPQHVFYCIRNFRGDDFEYSINEPHYSITVSPPNSDPADADTEACLILINNDDDSFTVLQLPVFSPILSAQEVNAILEQIAESNRQVDITDISTRLIREMIFDDRLKKSN